MCDFNISLTTNFRQTSRTLSLFSLLAVSLFHALRSVCLCPLLTGLDVTYFQTKTKLDIHLT